MPVKKIGELLLNEQMITEEDLEKALAEQHKTGDPLGEVLVRQGAIGEESLYRFLAVQHGLEFHSLADMHPAADILKIMPPHIAWKYLAVPVGRENGCFTVATAQPDDLSLYYLPREIKLPADSTLKMIVAVPSEVKKTLEANYPKDGRRTRGEIQTRDDAPIKEVEEEPDKEQLGLLESVEQELLDVNEDIDLEILDTKKEEETEDDIGDEGPVIKMCNYIIIDAVRKRASDVHITPYEKKILLRFRIDGSLVEFKAPPVNMHRRLAARYKIMAKLNIIERRTPQDGRIHMVVDRRPVDIRIATIPTRFGENIVMRVINQTTANLDLDTIGFEPEQLDQFKRAISAPYGMVFVTGPTASGKTTTLFAALSHINTPTKNIVTVEDPVEFRLPHIVQIQVDSPAGRSFASVLRAFLRHDPNVMLVGEIRDGETANIAVKASMTGHLVLSSLHTNDAPSSIMRLVDMGIEPAYVGSSVLAVASQRLVRRICENCKEEIKVGPEELKRVGLTPESVEGTTFYKGKGCSNCHNSGYRGRCAVFEVLPITAALREIIFSKGSLPQLKAAAREAGFKNLREAALMKWRQGVTTLEEVLGETFE